MSKNPKGASQVDRPLLQWGMAGLGLAVTLSAIGVVAWEALQPTQPARLEARLVSVRPVTNGYLAEIQVSNTGTQAAAGVTISTTAAEEPSTTTLDYVPGHGSAVGFLRLATTSGVGVAVIGWSEP